MWIPSIIFSFKNLTRLDKFAILIYYTKRSIAYKDNARGSDCMKADNRTHIFETMPVRQAVLRQILPDDCAD